MLMPDAGSPIRRAPAPIPQVRHDVQVDPGDLQDFARFLDQMVTEVSEIEIQMKRYADADEPADFGQHHFSSTANSRHNRALESAYNNVQVMRKRLVELVEGTLELSKQYHDLDELNAAAAADIAAALASHQEKGVQA